MKKIITLAVIGQILAFGTADAEHTLRSGCAGRKCLAIEGNRRLSHLKSSRCKFSSSRRHSTSAAHDITAQAIPPVNQGIENFNQLDDVPAGANVPVIEENVRRGFGLPDAQIIYNVAELGGVAVCAAYSPALAVVYAGGRLADYIAQSQFHQYHEWRGGNCGRIVDVALHGIPCAIYYGDAINGFLTQTVTRAPRLAQHAKNGAKYAIQTIKHRASAAKNYLTRIVNKGAVAPVVAEGGAPNGLAHMFDQPMEACARPLFCEFDHALHGTTPIQPVPQTPAVCAADLGNIMPAQTAVVGANNWKLKTAGVLIFICSAGLRMTQL